MTYEQRFKSKLKDPIFLEKLKNIRKEWNLDQRKFPTIGNYFKDSEKMMAMKKVTSNNKLFKKVEESKYFVKNPNGELRLLTSADFSCFFDTVKSIVTEEKLPLRFGNFIQDYLVYGKIKRKTKVALSTSGYPITESSIISIIVSPDTRQGDVKKIWKNVVELQRIISPSTDKKTQIIQNEKTFLDIIGSEFKGKKIDKMKIHKRMGTIYKTESGMIYETESGKQRIRNMKSRYLKKAKRIEG